MLLGSGYSQNDFSLPEAHGNPPSSQDALEQRDRGHFHVQDQVGEGPPRRKPTSFPEDCGVQRKTVCGADAADDGVAKRSYM